MHIGFLDETKDIYIYQQEEMLIKSQVTRMHVLNICVSNGFIYLVYMTWFVCTIWSQDYFIIFSVDLT